MKRYIKKFFKNNNIERDTLKPPKINLFKNFKVLEPKGAYCVVLRKKKIK